MVVPFLNMTKQFCGQIGQDLPADQRRGHGPRQAPTRIFALLDEGPRPTRAYVTLVNARSTRIPGSSRRPTTTRSVGLEAPAPRGRHRDLCAPARRRADGRRRLWLYPGPRGFARRVRAKPGQKVAFVGATGARQD
ncbi:MAG: hypothetical protein ACLTSX_11370 [Collinsella sp.]